MNIARIKPRPENLENLIAGECFKIIGDGAINDIFMVVSIPSLLIDKETPSVVPISEAVFVVSVESGNICIFAKDVVVYKIFATFQYIL